MHCSFIHISLSLSLSLYIVSQLQTYATPYRPMHQIPSQGAVNSARRCSQSLLLPTASMQHGSSRPWGGELPLVTHLEHCNIYNNTCLHIYPYIYIYTHICSNIWRSYVTIMSIDYVYLCLCRVWIHMVFTAFIYIYMVIRTPPSFHCHALQRDHATLRCKAHCCTMREISE